MSGERVVRSPLEGQSLAEYLQSFTEEETREISEHAELLIELARILQASFSSFEAREDSLEKLWKIISHVNDFDRLLYFIERLEPVRRKLLKQLTDKANGINQISRACTIGRLLGSSVDIAGTIGGLWMRETNPGYANLAFTASTAFGLLGFVSTTAEMSNLKNSFDESMKLIKMDQEYFAPIQRWYQQNFELEQAMRAVFPFDVTSHLLAKFDEVSSNELTPVRILATLLKSVVEHDPTKLRDEILIQNLISFAMNPASKDWVEWVIFRRHPVVLDITRVILQLRFSPLKFALCQSIPAMAVNNQSITSFPVLGRIGLNLISISDAVSSLMSSEMSTLSIEMQHLRRHLESELASLQRIAAFVQSRRRSNQEPEAS